MAGRRTLDQKGMSDLLSKKNNAHMDSTQQAAWELIKKLQVLGTLIDYYTELEDVHKKAVRNDSLDFLFKDEKIMKVGEEDFSNLLKLFKEATKFILERELVLQKYQKSLDSKNLLENDPIFAKVTAISSRVKVLEMEKENLVKRNKALETDSLALKEAEKVIQKQIQELQEKDLLVKVASC